MVTYRTLANGECKQDWYVLQLLFNTCVSSLHVKVYDPSNPINHSDNYDDLQRDIDAIQECISTSHLTLYPTKCKYLANCI